VCQRTRARSARSPRLLRTTGTDVRLAMATTVGSAIVIAVPVARPSDVVTRQQASQPDCGLREHRLRRSPSPPASRALCHPGMADLRWRLPRVYE
jgi:hypothetical protein